MRLGWSPSTRAGLLGTGAMLLCPRAPIGSSPPRRRPRTRRGAGFGRSTFVGPPSRASPSSWGDGGVASRACTDLAGRARAPAGASKTGPFDVYRIFTKVPGQRATNGASIDLVFSIFFLELRGVFFLGGLGHRPLASRGGRRSKDVQSSEFIRAYQQQTD